jgi:hypothetical protein
MGISHVSSFHSTLYSLSYWKKRRYINYKFIQLGRCMQFSFGWDISSLARVWIVFKGVWCEGRQVLHDDETGYRKRFPSVDVGATVAWCRYSSLRRLHIKIIGRPTSANCKTYPRPVLHSIIERCGWVVNIPASYSGDLRFRSQVGDWLSGLIFSWFPSVLPCSCWDSTSIMMIDGVRLRLWTATINGSIVLLPGDIGLWAWITTVEW